MFAPQTDPLLGKIAKNLRIDPTASLHTFHDDLSIHTSDRCSLLRVFCLMLEEARDHGLDINADKSALRARADAPHLFLFFWHQGKAYGVGTASPTGIPHSKHKYLSLFVPDYSPAVTYSHCAAVIGSFLFLWPPCTFRQRGAEG